MNTKRSGRFRRTWRIVSTAAVLSVFALSGTVPANAADDGNWWYSAFGVPEVQTQGITGEGVRIAVIDKVIDKNIPNLAGTNLSVYPKSFCGGSSSPTKLSDEGIHGTNIVSLLVGNGTGVAKIRGISPAAQVTFYPLGTDAVDGVPCTSGDNDSGIGAAISQAVKDGNRIIAIPMVASSASRQLLEQLGNALASGSVIVAGGPNDTLFASSPYFWKINGVVAVGSFDSAGNLMSGTNDPASPPLINPGIDVVAPGVNLAGQGKLGDWNMAGLFTGNSGATPLVAGVLADVWQKYPKATGNQLLQSLIRNTTSSDHALKRDSASGLGYGPVSLRHMLAKDPSQYPDVNPMTEGKLATEAPVPTYSDPGSAVSHSSDPATVPGTQTPASSAAASTGHSDGLVQGLVWVLIAVGVLILGVVIAIVVVISKRRKTL